MSFTQLDPTLPMVVEGKGSGYALAVIDHGPGHHLSWVIAIDETGEIWAVPNSEVRMQSNWTMDAKSHSRRVPSLRTV